MEFDYLLICPVHLADVKKKGLACGEQWRLSRSPIFSLQNVPQFF